MSEAVEPRESYAPAEPGLLDEVERRLVELGAGYQKLGEELPGFPLRHIFTPGLYVREITMPAGSMLSTKIHKTEHPFVVSRGSCSVFVEGKGFIPIRAPYIGITKPGTRRLLIMNTETVWTTFHPNPDDVQDVEELERMLTEEYDNPLLEGLVIPGRDVATDGVMPMLKTADAVSAIEEGGTSCQWS